MAEVTNEPMFELMKRIHDGTGDLKAGQMEIRQQLISIRGHMQPLQNDVNNVHGILGRHEIRLHRIEKRLEMSAFAETQANFDPDM